MTVASCRRLPRRPSTDPTRENDSPPNSGLMTAANRNRTGNRVAAGNQLPSRKPNATILQVATRNESNPVLVVEFGSRPNQERPAVAATVNAARHGTARSRSRRIASAKGRARSTSVPTAGLRFVTPPAATRRKRATARGGAAAGAAAVRRLRMAERSPSATSILSLGDRVLG